MFRSHCFRPPKQSLPPRTCSQSILQLNVIAFELEAFFRNCCKCHRRRCFLRFANVSFSCQDILVLWDLSIESQHAPQMSALTAAPVAGPFSGSVLQSSFKALRTYLQSSPDLCVFAFMMTFASRTHSEIVSNWVDDILCCKQLQWVLCCLQAGFGTPSSVLPAKGAQPGPSKQCEKNNLWVAFTGDPALDPCPVLNEWFHPRNSITIQSSRNRRMALVILAF